MLSIFNSILNVFKLIFVFFQTLITRILALILLVPFALILTIYATNNVIDINSDMLAQAGISDITLIDSYYEVSGRFEREYQNISYDEYQSYAYSVVDYLESKGYTIYCEDPEQETMEFFTTFHYIAPCSSIDDIFLDYSKTECSVCYIYNDVIHCIEISYCDDDTVYLFIRPESDISSFFHKYKIVTPEPEIA